MICTWLICPVGFVHVASMPNVYESSARVYVDTSSVLQPLLRGLALQTDPSKEVAMMVQTLLSRPNIEIIARGSDLDISASNAVEYENLINSLSNKIRLRATGRNNLYTISYSHQDPEMAKTVVQKTLDLFVESTKGNNKKDSDSANRFIDEQIDEYAIRLSVSEKRLSNFKRKYSELLPKQGSFYQNYASLEGTLESTRLTIKETEQKIVALSEQIEYRKTNQDGSSVRPFEGPSSLTTRYDGRINTLEKNLDQLTLMYTELHPDVIGANNLLDSLLASRKLEIEEYLSLNDGEKPEQIGSIASEIKLEMSRLESQIASLRVTETYYTNGIETLKQKIDLVPQVEAEQTALNRDYEVTRKKHFALLSRKEQADLAQKANVSAEKIQFKVVEPPIAPKTASGPNRLLFYTITLVIGFATGLGLAFLISQFNPVLVMSSQLTSSTSYPVFGVVTHLDRIYIKKINRSKLLVFICSSSLIVGLYGVLMSAEIMNFYIYARIFS
jgi:polysaccharide chain length determinant protein (PEP-CTERM system associated)